MDYKFFKVALIFVFGLITVEIYNIYLPRSKKILFKEKFLYSFLYGSFIYIVYDIVSYISVAYNNRMSEVEFKSLFMIIFNDLPKSEESFKFTIGMIIKLTIISILFGFFLSHFRTKRYAIKFGNKFMLKDPSIGSDSLLESIYEIDEENFIKIRNMWVQIKLLDGTASYLGFLTNYEMYSDRVEILLDDVDIYFEKNIFKEKNYKQHSIYLNLLHGTYIIEYAESSQENND